MTFAEEDTNGHQEESEGQEAPPSEGHAAEAQGWRRDQRRGQPPAERFRELGRLGRWIGAGLCPRRRYLQWRDVLSREIHHREVIWFEPRIVAEVSYAELVQGGCVLPC